MWRIALLGAESTGKTTLASQLANRLQEHITDRSVVVVPEYLREWCAIQGRIPCATEQLNIANTQAQRIDAAASTGAIVIADTTPLMTAIYSDFYFSDVSLYDEAIGEQQKFDLHLLMGADFSWQADGAMRDGPVTQSKVDALLRERLLNTGLRFHTIYGTPEQRIETALSLVLSLLKTKTITHDDGDGIDNKVSNNIAVGPYCKRDGPCFYLKNHGPFCTTCSDPESERQLFTRLLNKHANDSARTDGWGVNQLAQ